MLAEVATPDSAHVGTADDELSVPSDIRTPPNPFLTAPDEVVSAQFGQRGLLRASESLAGNLTLPVVLRQIVQAGCELVQARYGALGVIDSTGGLEQFVHVGLDAETVARIGDLPEGRGLLGASIADPRPIRLRTMADDPRSAGFPEGHPPMTSFLGVPVRVGDEVFGNLYLTERAGGEFTARDEELVSALAITAGVAIQNAQLYEIARRRQDSLQAFNEVTRQLLSADGEEPLRLIARQARKIADAEVVTVVLPTADGQRLMVEAAAGAGADELTARTTPLEGSLAGVALDSGQPLLVGDIEEDQRYVDLRLSEIVPTGPVMVLPFGGSPRMRGALVFGRPRGRRPFAEADLEMATIFANHAAVALELADARADQQRIVLLEERDRIARDLHDHSIQRLFAIGLTVQSVAREQDAAQREARLTRVVADIDQTIRQIRTFIFELRGPLGPETSATRSRLVGVVDQIATLLDVRPRLIFTGPVDAVVPQPVVEDLVAVVREALTNTARHAGAARIEVEITATVDDDGIGLGDSERRSGLANLKERADHRGGSLVLLPSMHAGGTADRPGLHLQWTSPLR
jgi:GAF domain-containing protein